MANSFIPVPAPAGTNLQAVVNTIGGTAVLAESVELVDSSGNEKGTVTNPVKVDGSNVTQPVSGVVVVKLQDAAGNGITSDARGSERPLSVQVLDASGNQVTTFASTGANAAASATGSAVPADASYTGFNLGGNLVGVSSVNPLPITGSISATNPSVSTTGSAIPSDATMIGGSDGTNLQALATDTAGQLKVLVENFPATQSVSGTVTADIKGNGGTALDSAAGTPNSQAVTIQGNASGVAVPVSVASLPLSSGAGSLLSGQGTATNSAAAIASSNPCKKVTVKNNVSSAATIYVGPSGVTAATGLELVPGDSTVIEISNVDAIFAITASGSGSFSWLAVN
jgi:hypothetical protein